MEHRPTPPMIRRKSSGLGGSNMKVSRSGSPQLRSRKSASDIGTPVARQKSDVEKETGKKEKKKETLQKVAKELVQSERGYTKDLEFTIQLYLKPLRGGDNSAHPDKVEEEDVSDLLTPQEINGIFSNIEQVLGINQVLLEALEKDSSVSGIAAALTKMSEYLKVYSIYCGNQEKSLKLVGDLTAKNSRFKNWLRSNQNQMLSRGLDLKDFLIKPTQRVCKYPLFLRELITNCDVNDPAYEILQTVDKVINGVVTHINEQRRMQAGLEGVAQIYKRLADSEYPLVQSQRVLVYSGGGGDGDLFVREILMQDEYNDAAEKTSSVLNLSEVKKRGKLSLSLKRSSSRKNSKGISSPRLSSPRGSPRTSERTSPRTPLSSAKSPRLGSGSQSPRFGRAKEGRRLSQSAIVNSSLINMGSSPSMGGGSSDDLNTGAYKSRDCLLFLFNDLFLCCRPSKQLGKKGLLDIHMTCKPDDFRVRLVDIDPLENCFLFRILRNGGPEIRTKYIFQCETHLELEGWMEQLKKVHPLGNVKSRNVGNGSLNVAIELMALRRKVEKAEEEMVLVQQKLKIFKLNKEKLDRAEQEGDATENSAKLGKLKQMAYGLPQWKFRAKDVKEFLQDVESWLEILSPLAKKATTTSIVDHPSSKIQLVSVRQQLKKVQEQQREYESHQGEVPPPLPEIDPEDEIDLLRRVLAEIGVEKGHDETPPDTSGETQSPKKPKSSKSPRPAGKPGMKRRVSKRKVKRKVKKRSSSSKMKKASPKPSSLKLSVDGVGTTPTSPAVTRAVRRQNRTSRSVPTSPRDNRHKKLMTSASDAHVVGKRAPPRRPPPKAPGQRQLQGAPRGFNTPTTPRKKSQDPKDKIQYIDMSSDVEEIRNKVESLRADADDAIDGYRKIKKALWTKINALEQLQLALKSLK